MQRLQKFSSGGLNLQDFKSDYKFKSETEGSSML